MNSSSLSTTGDVPHNRYELNFVGSVPMAPSASEIVSECTALAFDPFQELLWSGSSNGKVSSNYGCALSGYTSFVASNSSSSIRSIEVMESGAVVAVSSKGISAFRRQGILLYTHSSHNLIDLICSCVIPPNSVVLGGNQQTIIQFDVESQKEEQIIHIKEKDCQLMRCNDRALYTSDSSGTITMRPFNTLEAVNHVVAHSGGVADFEVSGNRLITCGYTSRTDYPHDPFVKLYDLRNLRALLPLSVNSPVLCRFANPFNDGQLLIASKFGQIIATDLNSTQSRVIYQLCNGAVPTSMAISSTKQCGAVGDSAGQLHLFSHRENAAQFNMNSWETIFPMPVEYLPSMPIDPSPDNDNFLTLVPTPLPSRHGFASDYWPEASLHKVLRKPRPIPAQLLQKATNAQTVLYAPNPRTGKLRNANVCPYDLN